jgi:hypothetical protein
LFITGRLFLLGLTLPSPKERVLKNRRLVSGFLKLKNIFKSSPLERI